MRSVAVRATLVGGLGNQMFIAATAAALAHRLNVALELDRGELRFDSVGRVFALDEFPHLAQRAVVVEAERSLPAPLRRRIDKLRRDVYVESSMRYDEAFSRIDHPVRLRGYFQSARYFETIDPRTLFALDAENARLRELESQVGSRWFAVHVRRGDYLTPATKAYHGLCDDTYFAQALTLLRILSGENLPVVMFTDEPSAVSAELRSRADLVLGPDPQFHEAVDLWAMSKAAGLVMSNSSFSWWAAYLGETLDRPVIAPRPWFRHDDSAASDLLLRHWMSLGSSG